MRRYLSVIAGLCALVWMSGAQAAPDVSVAVLGIEPVDVPESLAQALTDALRQRAASTGGVRIVQGKDLIEVKMVFNCDGEAPACMAHAGSKLGADKLLYGTVKKSGKVSVTVALKLLDVKSAVVEKFTNDTVHRRDLAGGNVNAAAGRWFAQLLEIERKPTLTVTSEPSGANVAVDGQQHGRTPLTLRDLAAGQHTVVVTMAGRQTATRTVDLRAGGAHDVVVTLEPETVAQKTTRPPPEPLPLVPSPSTTTPTKLRLGSEQHPGRTAMIIGGVLVGAAVVTGGVLIYTWRKYDDELAGKTSMDLAALGPAMTAEEMTFINSPSCTVPSTIQNRKPMESATYKSDCDSGNTFANATTGLWVATGALALGGVVSFIVGERQMAKAKERNRGVSLLRQTLRVAPVFSTRGGGITAAFEF
jgi:hypothetical protein